MILYPPRNSDVIFGFPLLKANMFAVAQIGAAPRRMLFTLLQYVEGAVLVYLARVFWPLPFSRDFVLLSSRSFIAGLQPVRAYAKPLAVVVLTAMFGFQLLLLAPASWLVPAVLSSLVLGSGGSFSLSR